MTEDEYSELLDNEHMVWCVGTHDPDGECVLETPLGDDTETVIRMQGVPADHQYIELDGPLFDLADIDAAIAVLTQLRERFAAQQVREAELEALYEQVV
jgi:hypothetical protein